MKATYCEKILQRLWKIILFDFSHSKLSFSQYIKFY